MTETDSGEIYSVINCISFFKVFNHFVYFLFWVLFLIALSNVSLILLMCVICFPSSVKNSSWNEGLKYDFIVIQLCMLTRSSRQKNFTGNSSKILSGEDCTVYIAQIWSILSDPSLPAVPIFCTFQIQHLQGHLVQETGAAFDFRKHIFSS